MMAEDPRLLDVATLRGRYNINVRVPISDWVMIKTEGLTVHSYTNNNGATEWVSPGQVPRQNIAKSGIFNWKLPRLNFRPGGAAGGGGGAGGDIWDELME